MQVTAARLVPMATTALEQLTDDSPVIEAWRAMLRANARLVRELDEELRREHGYALGDFDVLIQLTRAPDTRLRMCDLAEAVVLSPSGLSRRVERLERAGLVTRHRSAADGRSIEAELTPAGRRLFRRLRATHFEGVRRHFADRFDEAELRTIAELLGRLREPATG